MPYPIRRRTSLFGIARHGGLFQGRRKLDPAHPGFRFAAPWAINVNAAGVNRERKSTGFRVNSYTALALNQIGGDALSIGIPAWPFEITEK